jgi:hypothetical protein
VPAPLERASLEPVSVIDSAAGCPALPIVVGGGHAQAVVWPGSGARHRSMHVIALERGATTVASSALGEGAMIHIDAGDSYQLCADAGPLRVLGGPCPADPQFYAHLAAD